MPDESWWSFMRAPSTKPQFVAGADGRLLTVREAAALLNMSVSFLAKARMQGDGPPYIKIGRAIRYAEVVLLQWTKSRQRRSTGQP